jgi:hypothetical protein
MEINEKQASGIESQTVTPFDAQHLCVGTAEMPTHIHKDKIVVPINVVHAET